MFYSVSEGDVSFTKYSLSIFYFTVNQSIEENFEIFFEKSGRNIWCVW